MDPNLAQIIGVFFVQLGASFLSGIAGGGGGVIVVPFLIALGLSPQQAIATTKLGGFGNAFGALAALRKKALENKKLAVHLAILAALVSLVVPVIFKRLSGRDFQIAIGVVMVMLIPFALSKKHGIVQNHTSKKQHAAGYFLLAVVFLLQGVFSSGVGSLNNSVLSSYFGLTTLQATSIRRFASLTLNIFIVISLIATTHFIVYQYAVVAFAGSLIGGYIGSHIALKKGDQFMKYALAAFMAASGIALLISAL